MTRRPERPEPEMTNRNHPGGRGSEALAWTRAGRVNGNGGKTAQKAGGETGNPEQSQAKQAGGGADTEAPGDLLTSVAIQSAIGGDSGVKRASGFVQ
jgi:hypothetical protein